MSLLVYSCLFISDHYTVCTVYSVHCTLYTVQNTVYSKQCTTHFVKLHQHLAPEATLAVRTLYLIVLQPGDMKGV